MLLAAALVLLAACAPQAPPAPAPQPEPPAAPPAAEPPQALPPPPPPAPSKYLYLTELQVKQAIDKANRCVQHDDCEDVGSKCPFGCNVHVNKAEAADIREMIDAFQSTCQYACLQFAGVKCQSGQCRPLELSVDLLRKIDDARDCQADSDCAWVSGDCLACGSTVNKAEVQFIQANIKAEESKRCATACPPPQGQPRCFEDECIPS